MTDINGGLLIRFTPGNSPGSVFEVVHNSVTDFHGTSSSAKENIITDALDNIWLHSLTGQNLFNDMLNSASSVYFTIGITSGSSFSSNGNVFDYKPLGPLGTSLPVFDESGNEIPLAARSNLYGMTLGLGDIVDGTDTNNSLLFDYKLYIGSDGAYHKFTAERVILHELSHSIRNTADISVDETTAITFQNTNTDYQSAAVEFANSVLEFNSTPARAAYLGNFSDQIQSQYQIQEGLSYTEGNPVEYVYSGSSSFGAYEVSTLAINTMQHGTKDGLIIGRDLSERIIAGDGDDYIYSDYPMDPTNPVDPIYGGQPDSASRGGGDVIHGGGGNDKIFAGGKNDIIFGGPGTDQLFGGQGRDIFLIEPGVDTILDGSAIDEIRVFKDYLLDPEGFYDPYSDPFSTPHASLTFPLLGGSARYDKFYDFHTGSLNEAFLTKDSREDSPTDRDGDGNIEFHYRLYDTYNSVSPQSSTKHDIGITYELEGTDLLIRIFNGDNYWGTDYENYISQIILSDFQEGDFGIRLSGEYFVSAHVDDSDELTSSDHEAIALLWQDYAYFSNFGQDISLQDVIDSLEQPVNEEPGAGTPGSDTISLTDSPSSYLAGAGDDAVFGNGGNDNIFGEGGNDTLQGGDGDDQLYGGIGDDILDGQDGADALNGGDGIDILTGGLGNDTVAGGNGDDTYIYKSGDGNDIISKSVSNNGQDRLDLSDLNPEDISLSAVPNSFNFDLVITINATGETILVEGQFGWPGSNIFFGIEEILFANGTIWDRSTIQANTLDVPASPIEGTSGADTILGTANDDTIFGDTGNDVLIGGGGGDRYVYSAFDGNDTIKESYTNSTDILFLVGFASSAVTFSGVSGAQDDLLITINGTGETILVKKHFWIQSATHNSGLDLVAFGDGTTLGRATIEADAWYRGTSGDDTITASTRNDTLDGSAGNDTLNASTGDDRLIGGLGDDTLRGYLGSDTYVYASGDGNDIIQENYANTTDTLELTDLNPSDVTLSSVSGAPDDLLITINGTGETILVKKHFWIQSATSNSGLDRIVFADGTIWDLTTIDANAWYRGTSGDDTITASSRSDTLDGGAGDDTLNASTGDDRLIGGLGDDTLRGYLGSDTYVYASGDGNDVIDEVLASGSDTLQFTDLNISDVTISGVSGAANDLQITINATGESILVDDHSLYNSTSNYSLEEIAFADGTIWDRATIDAADIGDAINGTAANDAIVGSSATDVLVGGLGDDSLDGGSGDDVLLGGSGNDTFIFKTGFGQDVITDFQAGATSDDAIEFDGIAAYQSFPDVVADAYQDGSDAVIELDASNSIRLSGIDVSQLHEDDFRFV